MVINDGEQPILYARDGEVVFLGEHRPQKTHYNMVLARLTMRENVQLGGRPLDLYYTFHNGSEDLLPDQMILTGPEWLSTKEQKSARYPYDALCFMNSVNPTLIGRGLCTMTYGLRISSVQTIPEKIGGV